MTTTSEPRTGQKTALVCGVSGQDGAYLSELLLDKGYRVVGTSRDSASANLSGLQTLGLIGRVELVSMVPNDFRSVLRTVDRHAPDEIYNLAGQSSVGLSFDQPVEAIESIALATLNLLEAIRFLGRPIRLYNAGSSETFGETGDAVANEDTPFRPRSPYAVAKACAHNLVANYRQAYGSFACTGILFNHESPLRPERFVTQKIVKAAHEIALGRWKEKLMLGNLEVHRDWGWAPEYVDAMWRMLQLPEPFDLVIATGRTVSLGHFVSRAFAHFGLDWRDHVAQDHALYRPSDLARVAGDPARAARVLGWQARTDVDEVIDLMCRARASRDKNKGADR